MFLQHSRQKSACLFQLLFFNYKNSNPYLGTLIPSHLPLVSSVKFTPFCPLCASSPSPPSPPPSSFQHNLLCTITHTAIQQSHLCQLSFERILWIEIARSQSNCCQEEEKRSEKEREISFYYKTATELAVRQAEAFVYQIQFVILSRQERERDNCYNLEEERRKGESERGQALESVSRRRNTQLANYHQQFGCRCR